MKKERTELVLKALKYIADNPEFDTEDERYCVHAKDFNYLIARVEKFHRDVSMIRRATDDIPELKDINRMAREALKEDAE